MPARRDTRREASRVRRLSPLQIFENQSRTWGIRCHSCTWREGLAPSWKAELQGSSSPRGLPGNQSSLSANGSHLHICGVKPTVSEEAQFNEQVCGAEAKHSRHTREAMC